MPKIPVKPQKIFGGSLPPAGNIAQFGSLAAANPAYSGDPAVIQSLAAWLNGLAGALINAPGGLASPALEDLNALFYVLTYQLAYLKQSGLSEWDPDTTYYIGSWARDVTGAPYISLTNDNVGNALNDTNNWKPLKSTLVQAGSSCKAWVNFNGSGPAAIIRSSFNVASVVKIATGSYLLTFNDALGDGDYAFSGSCGAANGNILPVAGDNNVIVGAAPGRVSTKTPAQLSVFCWEPKFEQLEDCSSISILIFGN